MTVSVRKNTIYHIHCIIHHVADVTNYILNSWGNSADVIVTEAYVREIKETK